MKIPFSKPHGYDPLSEESEEDVLPFLDNNLPKVSIIIPTFNAAHLIASTLETLLIQDYPNFEIIIIDAGSTDRTLEVVKSFRNFKLLIYSVSAYSRYEMLNKGITHATGEYLNFLFPGDFYIYKRTLREMMTLAKQKNNPDMVYCGTLLRDGKSEVKILYRQMSLSLLRTGRQPTSLQSCWFKHGVFKQIGKFNTQLKLRGGLDLLCRIAMLPSMQVVSLYRVFTDYDLRSVTRGMVVRHFSETIKIVSHYFGAWAAIKWLFTQKDASRYLKLWWRSVKVAFIGK